MLVFLLACRGVFGPGAPTGSPTAECVRSLSEVCTDCPDLETDFDDSLPEDPLQQETVVAFECEQGGFALRALTFMGLGHFDYFDSSGAMVGRLISTDTPPACDYGEIPACDFACYLPDLVFCGGASWDTPIGCVESFDPCFD